MKTTEILTNLHRVGCLGIARRLAAEYRVPLEDVLTQRTRTTTLARHRLWSIVRDTLDLSYTELERLFGADHTTIIVGVQKAHARLAREHAA